mmetsp:Transcript_17394/g.26804  ORF Transcript_17394/g.26804 Transcript_17394/m.26804 type:complete len:163 (-) Transcript_17394:1203-1691(-)
MEISKVKRPVTSPKGLWLGDFGSKQKRSESIIQRNPNTGEIFHSAEAKKETLEDISSIEDSLLVKLCRWAMPTFLFYRAAHLLVGVLNFLSFRWLWRNCGARLASFKERLKSDRSWTGLCKLYTYKAVAWLIWGAAWLVWKPFTICCCSPRKLKEKGQDDEV